MAERSAASRSLAAANGHGAQGDIPAVTARLAVPSAAQMRLLGTRLARLLRAGDLVVLAGSLGAGKTTLVQGLGEGLAVRGPVTSPTFVIARVHPSLRGGPDLVHADAFRLGSRLEVDDLDLEAELDHSITVVEWGEGLVENLAAGHLRVTIDRQAPEPAIAPDAAGDPADGPGDPGSDPGDPGSGPGDPGSGPGDPGNGPGDQVRIVTVSGYGNRWDGAAGQLRRVLAEVLR
jgi:tRNA threonylcarbamoyladenosine biosynthesis protein TsaE